MKASIFVLALALTAGTAMATDGYVIGYEPISDLPAPTTRASNSVVFSAIPGPYQAFAAAPGVMGFDDYDSALAGGNAFLQSFRFVGGLAATGNIRVEFYDAGANLINQFNVNSLPAGNNIWNIGLESVAGAKDSTFLIPEAGFVQIVSTSAGVNGQWFLSTTVPSVGTSSLLAGSTTTHTHRFELTVPAPGAMALLGLGGLVAARRRR